MPSLEDSRQQVKAGVEDEVDHEAILASLQDEIDRHNAIKDGLKDDIRRSERSTSYDQSRDRPTKFRFKSTTKDSRDHRKRHRGSRHHEQSERESHHRRKRKRNEYPTPSDDEAGADEAASHPFPREPADPQSTDQNAFRASLFDALADDEGAAAYWESVYSQPIHIYPRPTVQDARTGKLDQMSDEEYVAYVKEKMWEKKNPEVVREREKKEKERKFEEEERTRRREEFVRKKERAAWERSQRWTGGDDNDEDEDRERWARYEYAFAGDVDSASQASSRQHASEAEYTSAWTTYLSAWQTLLFSRETGNVGNPSSQIPWPVLSGKPVLKPNIEAFLHRLPATNSAERLRMLKAERVRWHPDKVQQRFGGKVDEGTMKLVTGVFQVIDGMLEVERKKSAG